jgi:small nuclear ribonucleoprotein (snRNP)-like protein
MEIINKKEKIYELERKRKRFIKILLSNCKLVEGSLRDFDGSMWS